MAEHAAPTHLDHLMLGGGRRLDELTADFARRTGVTPADGGRHADAGTHNALAGLGGCRYFELIAADPEGDPAARLGRLVAATDPPAILAWAIAVEDLDGAIDRACGLGYDPGSAEPLARERPDGMVLRWRLAWRGAGVFQGVVPFLIEWRDCPHPATTAPQGCRLVAFHAEHPRPGAVRPWLDALEVDLVVEKGPRPALVAGLETPRGRVTLR